MISARTKAALAAAKARGVRLVGQRGSLDRMGRMARKGNAASAKRSEDRLPHSRPPSLRRRPAQEPS
jgi:hypothetical protein